MMKELMTKIKRHVQRVGENICPLTTWQRINIQDAQKTLVILSRNKLKNGEKR